MPAPAQRLPELAVAPPDPQRLRIDGLRFDEAGAADLAQVLAGLARHLVVADAPAALPPLLDLLDVVPGVEGEPFVLDVALVAEVAEGGCPADTADVSNVATSSQNQ